MSNVQKRPRAQVLAMAERIVERLAPACDRILIAGSLRRQVPMVGDIEILAVPTPCLDLFGNETGETLVEAYLRSWDVRLTKNGQKYKQFSFDSTSGQTYTVDLFLVPGDTWGLNLVVRTGPAAFSKWLVTAKSQGGGKPDDLVICDGFQVWRGRDRLDVSDETCVFRLWGLPYVMPEDRDSLVGATAQAQRLGINGVG